MERMKAAAAVDKEIKALQAKKAAIQKGEVPVEKNKTNVLPVENEEKKKKRQRDEKDESSEESSSDSESESDSTSPKSSEESSASDSSDSSSSRRRRKKAKKTKGKLKVRHVLANWRRQARKLQPAGREQMKQLLRLLKRQRRTVTKKALHNYVEELHYLYNKHTRGKMVADQYRINKAAKATKDSAGLLDMKDVMSAQKQVEALRVIQESKNADGSTKTQSNPGSKRNRKHESRPQQQAATGQGVCWKCKLPGHKASECPSSKPKPK
jgi:hypothetical protein